SAPLLEARGQMLGIQTQSVGASTAITTLGNASGVAAGKMQVFRAALLAVGRATLIIGLIQLLTEVIFNLGGVLEFLRPILVGFADAIAAPARVIGGTISALGNLAATALKVAPPLAGVAKVLGIFGAATSKISGANVNK